MAREDDALARRAAREARRAARRVGDLPQDQPSESGDDNGSAADPVRAAREAATAAAVGAAVGAVRALTARHRDGEEEPVAEDDESLAEHEEEAADEDEATMPEAEAETDRERRDDRGGRDRRERKAADLGQVEWAVQTARAQLRQLSGTEAETVSSFSRTRDGWRVTLEVVEVRRIPETTDVLASYAVELDDDGNLVAYERVRRYQRSEALDGS
jgi:hypothetical protein